MIDHQKVGMSSPQESIDEQPLVVTVKVEEKPNNLSKNTTIVLPDNGDNSCKQQVKALKCVTTSFGSRASAILRAALSDCNRQELKQNTTGQTRQQGKPSAQPSADPALTIEAQQATTPVNPSRISRTKVIFTDPVVSRKYEYEPTPVIQHLTPELRRTLMDRRRTLMDRRRTLMDRRRTSLNRRRTLSKRRTSLNRGKSRLLPAKPACRPSCNPDGEEDDEEEVFVLAPSDIPGMLIDTAKKSPIKRPHELTLTSSDDDEDEDSCSINADADQKSPKISSQDDGCLFSSPKVAKIAPYYHDESLGTKKSNFTSSNRMEKVTKPNGLPTLLSYSPFTFKTESNPIQQQCSTECELDAAQQNQSIFGLIGSLYRHTTSYLFPAHS